MARTTASSEHHEVSAHWTETGPSAVSDCKGCHCATGLDTRFRRTPFGERDCDEREESDIRKTEEHDATSCGCAHQQLRLIGGGPDSSANPSFSCAADPPRRLVRRAVPQHAELGRRATLLDSLWSKPLTREFQSNSHVGHTGEMQMFRTSLRNPCT